MNMMTSTVSDYREIYYLFRWSLQRDSNKLRTTEFLDAVIKHIDHAKSVKLKFLLLSKF